MRRSANQSSIRAVQGGEWDCRQDAWFLPVWSTSGIGSRPRLSSGFAGWPPVRGSIAARWAKIGCRTGVPGNASARLTSRSRRARSSSAEVMPLTSWARSRTGQPRPLVLLGQHLIKSGLEPLTGRRHRGLPAAGTVTPAPRARVSAPRACPALSRPISAGSLATRRRPGLRPCRSSRRRAGRTLIPGCRAGLRLATSGQEALRSLSLWRPAPEGPPPGRRRR